MFKKLLSPAVVSVDAAAFLLRLVFCGLILYNHAFVKLTLFGESPDSFPDPVGIGSTVTFYFVMFAEIVCGSLVLIGLFTRMALLPLLATMAVALFRVQWSNPLTDQELPLVYLGVFAALMFLGPGRWSVDGQVKGIRKR